MDRDEIKMIFLVFAVLFIIGIITGYITGYSKAKKSSSTLVDNPSLRAKYDEEGILRVYFVRYPRKSEVLLYTYNLRIGALYSNQIDLQRLMGIDKNKEKSPLDQDFYKFISSTVFGGGTIASVITNVKIISNLKRNLSSATIMAGVIGAASGYTLGKFIGYRIGNNNDIKKINDYYGDIDNWEEIIHNYILEFSSRIILVAGDCDCEDSIKTDRKLLDEYMHEQVNEAFMLEALFSDEAYLKTIKRLDVEKKYKRIIKKQVMLIIFQFSCLVQKFSLTHLLTILAPSLKKG